MVSLPTLARGSLLAGAAAIGGLVGEDPIPGTQGGVTTYLEVLTAQSAALANERAAVELQGRRLAASVLLVKTLGGGWDASKLRTVDAAAAARPTRAGS